VQIVFLSCSAATIVGSETGLFEGVMLSFPQLHRPCRWGRLSGKFPANNDLQSSLQFNGILSKNRGKFPKFVLSSAENALDSNFGNFLPQNIEMIRLMEHF
jgi:hypothetical protein